MRRLELTGQGIAAPASRDERRLCGSAELGLYYRLQGTDMLVVVRDALLALRLPPGKINTELTEL